MIERDYKKEYQQTKTKRTMVGLSLDLTTASTFKQKCEDEGITRNEFLKACVDAYLDNSLIYENGKLNMN